MICLNASLWATVCVLCHVLCDVCHPSSCVTDTTRRVVVDKATVKYDCCSYGRDHYTDRGDTNRVTISYTGPVTADSSYVPTLIDHCDRFHKRHQTASSTVEDRR